MTPAAIGRAPRCYPRSQTAPLEMETASRIRSGPSGAGGMRRERHRRGPPCCYPCTERIAFRVPMSAPETEITAFLQRKLAMLDREDVAAVQAARWLDNAGLLTDSSSRPGKPLRDLLRAGKIDHAEQRPPTANGRWFIVNAPSSNSVTVTTGGEERAPAPQLLVDDSQGPVSRRRCTAAEVQEALTALAREVVTVPARDWPGGLRHLDQAGLYSWWVDAAGAQELSAGLAYPIAEGRIYAGQAGATKWPSGKRGTRTLAGRIGANHLNGRIRGSTFRLTLAASLLEPLSLVQVTAKQIDGESEQRLSDWMRAHLAVGAMPFPERDPLGDLEHRVLVELDPPLNLEGMPRTPLRLALSRKRGGLS
jgi:hypothetical protein